MYFVIHFNLEEVSEILTSKGVFYFNQKNYPQAVTEYCKALKISTTTNNTANLIVTYQIVKNIMKEVFNKYFWSLFYSKKI